MLFWQHLSQANLIENSITNPTIGLFTYLDASTSPAITDYFPQAKIGKGNYVYIFSGGYGSPLGGNNGNTNTMGNSIPDNFNYFGISRMATSRVFLKDAPFVTPNFTVGQAYSIDKKLDDGLPQYGKVLAIYALVVPTWAPPYMSDPVTNGPTIATISYLPSNCYDNDGILFAKQKYQLKNSESMNCFISLRVE